MTLPGGLAAMLLAAGVVAALLGLMGARTGKSSKPSIQAGLGLMLDLWLAAGLLQLAGEPRWSAIATNAILIALRMLLRVSLAHAPG